MGKIKIKNIRVFAHHGCLKEETAIGSEYSVDVGIRSNLSKASFSDKLADTVDYVHINRIVKEEMKLPSKLLEHVARRILERMLSELTNIIEAEVSVSKLNPPINGDVEMVSVILNTKDLE
ncbi:dihydroneopterin aldolase [Kriegella aquimaris]|uniref:7,8-dihydroneopterin aldolase n=1 Tax=Kriegella aquimaris TaxID=192904 RepID=A0A1G9Y5Y9_9FLAO|nr:dihydroneopterin aldolase [Kriegella aquimaris]SDN04552.1 dihydroneopterin aldolase [Kriegella aquimaris]